MQQTQIQTAFALFLALAIALVTAASASDYAETIIMRSGGGVTYGQIDPTWTFLRGEPQMAISAAPFTPAQFAAALSGPHAVVVEPHEFWSSTLTVDPEAQWISTDAHRGPASALYACTFNVEPCCISIAEFNIAWSSDNAIGDYGRGGGNPAGIYLNRMPLVGVYGGGALGEMWGYVDVTGMLHCGVNEIHVYNRDGTSVPETSATGLLFKISILVFSCPLATEGSTWGAVKSMYR